jgi:hypothetical protein
MSFTATAAARTLLSSFCLRSSIFALHVFAPVCGFVVILLLCDMPPAGLPWPDSFW